MCPSFKFLTLLTAPNIPPQPLCTPSCFILWPQSMCKLPPETSCCPSQTQTEGRDQPRAHRVCPTPPGKNGRVTVLPSLYLSLPSCKALPKAPRLLTSFVPHPWPHPGAGAWGEARKLRAPTHCLRPGFSRSLGSPAPALPAVIS